MRVKELISYLQKCNGNDFVLCVPCRKIGKEDEAENALQIGAVMFDTVIGEQKSRNYVLIGTLTR